MFTSENTTGYTQAELDTLNVELLTRLADIDPGNDWLLAQVEHSFSDEVSRR